MRFRKMNSVDVPVAFEITLSGREQSFSREALAAVGITEEFVVDVLDGVRSHEGWVCESDEKVVGFAMGNRNTGEVWIIAVLPEHEGKGIGSKLYTLTEDWFRSTGRKEIWLAVLQDIQKTAYAFFKKRGWVDDDMRGDFRIMKKRLVDVPLE